MKNLKLASTTFLKLTAASPRSKLSALRKLMGAGGYDFYKVMKKLAAELASGKIDLAAAELQIAKITKDSERTHTFAAIKKIDAWLKTQELPWRDPPTDEYATTEGGLTIKLNPELAFVGPDGATIVVSIWNLAKPHDLPPLNWSSLKYGFDEGGLGRWQGRDTRQRRLSRSCGRSMC